MLQGIWIENSAVDMLPYLCEYLTYAQNLHETKRTNQTYFAPLSSKENWTQVGLTKNLHQKECKAKLSAVLNITFKWQIIPNTWMKYKTKLSIGLPLGIFRALKVTCLVNDAIRKSAGLILPAQYYFTYLAQV